MIDAHVNVTHNGKWFSTGHDASFQRLDDQMAAAKVEKAVIISMPGATTNAFIASLVEKYPGRFKGLGHIDFSKDIRKEINEIAAMGLSGVKIHPRLQGVNVCEAKFSLLWEELNARNMPVLVDGFYTVSNPNLRIGDLLPLAYEPMVKKYPDLTVVLAHAGAHRVMDTFFMCRSNPGFYTDISYSPSFFKGSSVYNDLRFLAEKTGNKVLFGSDFPEVSIEEAKKEFFELSGTLDVGIRERIAHGNAHDLFWKGLS
ncbi:MAG: hypothetical protein A2268_15390 [Candidatus Raymondbacteria bacterium RifOxyA12_full_50_37]|uniref:Amidohydrolase-related domain-containing protein n=1 Tax=Candidatus Raymondbacteria bacterium RIFOXYD12_FULL_49_13 TaxID=1817890 RepID=A0A1F7F779_UNCRA|nr:MAG: hypothetical protein A2268_15390 [Candidatus Raymondbacteria bacterium RifOxyA12_full_50_37]OGJ88463.1 MAG: hypothetical protein A2248_19875 [Candidatus Raymondbacteria bacterium RIFOXYA2_FULL_49_16]OGJ96445.1 MAG: hypothetical protein A2350_15840 [Candidatus Raymondbacteria bacterium RifOxyB12_full_50_8]OGJ98923.1 MAG: hypothetical protein A2453_10590 [Candidatus Raymondbacteria bacterium RIFOXYC2_FULL_50_21]OGK02377.1 MAG: hypothetical protein A2519_16030 [Candidatus Raymondbacteria b